MRVAVRTLVTTAVVLFAAGLPVLAQGPLSTGSFVANRDVNWDVAVGTGPFVDAFQVANNPGWGDFTGPTIARWISFATSASNPGGSPYYFRTSFDLTGYDPTTASLGFQCALDNALDVVRLNGNSVAGAVCPFGNLSGVQNINSGFISGVNTLEFQIRGDGTTDGFIYNTTSFSAQAAVVAAPEPSAVVLLATGLGALGVMRRKRPARG